MKPCVNYGLPTHLCLFTDIMESSPIPGQRLSSFAEEWRKAGADPALVQLVHFGHKIKFEHGTPTLTKPLQEFETKLEEGAMNVVRKEVATLLEKNAVRKLNWDEASKNLGHYSQIFTVPKPNGKHRVVINMKPLNEQVKKEKFRMETIKDVKSLIQPNDYGAVVDLTDAYYTVSLHKDSRKYCRFILDGTVYEYVALPMGLTCSARIFTRIALFIGSRLRRRGVRIVLYLDDLLVLASSMECCNTHVSWLVLDIATFGFLLNVAKSNLEPSQTFQYLGLIWDTVAWRISLKIEREVKIRSNAQQLLKTTKATCRVVAVFLGRTNSAIGAIPLARARTRILQWEFLSVCTSQQMYDCYMVISEQVKEELRFWASFPEGLSSPITLPEASATLSTDASESGIGILYEGQLDSEPIPEECMDWHINVKELWALSRFLDIHPNVSDITITWRVDNNSALAAIRNQGLNPALPATH